MSNVVAQQFDERGTLLFSKDEIPLNDEEWQQLEQLINSAEYEHVVGGDCPGIDLHVVDAIGPGRGDRAITAAALNGGLSRPSGAIRCQDRCGRRCCFRAAFAAGTCSRRACSLSCIRGMALTV